MQLSLVWALVHEPKQASRSPTPAISGPDRVGGRATELSHPVQHFAGDPSFSLLCVRVTSPEAATEDRLVPEERILDGSLAVVTGLLFPLSSPDLLDSCDRSVTSRTRHHASSANGCVAPWRNDNGSPSCCGRVVDLPRVVRGVRDEVGQFTVELVDKSGDGRGVICIPIGSP